MFGLHLRVKSIPELFCERYGDIPKKIFVRKCYEALYESATETHTRRGYSATLFTGVPGIGKSLFLVYFIYRFLCDERFPDKTFALEFIKGTYICFQPTGVENEYWCSYRDATSMPTKRFLLLCDIAEQVEPVSRAKWTYIFSSPAPSRYKEILTNKPHRTYILPTWSQNELMFVRSDIENWYDEFVLFGGVPRYIFPNPADDSPRALLNACLLNKGGSISEGFFKFGFGAVDWMQSYLLVHINPPVSSAGEFDYRGEKCYTFASDSIFKLLAKKHSAQMLAGAVGLFNAGAASETYGAVSAGKLFEKVCLWLKPLDGKRFVASSLSGALNMNVLIPSKRQVLRHDWKKSADLVPGTFYVPRISNLESGDSFYLAELPYAANSKDSCCGFMLVVLQVTVGKAHPVKVNGLHDIFLAFPANVRERVTRKALVFVLPAHGELDREQQLQSQKEEQMDAARVPIAVRGFEQFVFRWKI